VSHRDPRAAARAAGVAIELADLGDWGGAQLHAEYDPAGPLVRVNVRALPAGPAAAIGAAVDRAVMHELYHHDEACGLMPRLATRAEREGAADAAADAGAHMERLQH
jgi:hypothetical protein